MDAAVKAAPYIHPRLASQTIKGDTDVPLHLAVFHGVPAREVLDDDIDRLNLIANQKDTNTKTLISGDDSD